MTFTPKNWAEAASCAGSGFEGFYPSDGGSQPGAISKICATCPVRLFCLAEGLGDRWGIWGGAGPRDRHRMTQHLSLTEIERVREVLLEFASLGEDSTFLADLIEKYRAPTAGVLRVLRFHPAAKRIYA